MPGDVGQQLLCYLHWRLQLLSHSLMPLVMRLGTKTDPQCPEYHSDFFVTHHRLVNGRRIATVVDQRGDNDGGAFRWYYLATERLGYAT